MSLNEPLRPPAKPLCPTFIWESNLCLLSVAASSLTPEAAASPPPGLEVSDGGVSPTSPQSSCETDRDTLWTLGFSPFRVITASRRTLELCQWFQSLTFPFAKNEDVFFLGGNYKGYLLETIMGRLTVIRGILRLMFLLCKLIEVFS